VPPAKACQVSLPKIMAGKQESPAKIVQSFLFNRKKLEVMIVGYFRFPLKIRGNDSRRYWNNIA
jgi:hypothetical protein